MQKIPSLRLSSILQPHPLQRPLHQATTPNPTLPSTLPSFQHEAPQQQPQSWSSETNPADTTSNRKDVCQVSPQHTLARSPSLIQTKVPHPTYPHSSFNSLKRSKTKSTPTSSAASVYTLKMHQLKTPDDPTSYTHAALEQQHPQPRDPSR